MLYLNRAISLMLNIFGLETVFNKKAKISLYKIYINNNPLFTLLNSSPLHQTIKCKHLKSYKYTKAALLKINIKN